MTETQIIQLFAQAAQDHTAIKWFDSGSSDFLFNSERNIEFPAFFIQSTGGTLVDGRVEYNYVAYCLDLPNLDTEQDHTAFQWDSNLANSRGTTFTALTDVVNRVKGANLQKFILTQGTVTQDNEQLDGAVGYRVDLTINMDHIIGEFPIEE